MSEEKNWKKYSKNKCTICNKKVSNNSKMCKECYYKSKIKYFGDKITAKGYISKDKDYLSKYSWRKNNKNKDLISKSKWLKNNKIKRKAQWLANKIKLKEHCEKCGISNKDYILERHHPDYNYPLKIITLCKCCHMEEHHGRARRN